MTTPARRMRIVCLTVLLSLMGCAHAVSHVESQPAAGIVGTWRLVEYWDRSSASAPVFYRFGNPPCGYIIYPATGHMSAQLVTTPVAPNLPRDSSQDGFPREGSEALAMLRRHISYFGTYRVDSSRHVVVHQVEGDVLRRYAGRNEERLFQLHGDSLVIGNDSTSRRVFVREKGFAEVNPACAATRDAPHGPPASKDAALEQLMQLERDVVRANNECDYDFFRRVEGEELVFRNSAGKVITRAEDLAEWHDGRWQMVSGHSSFISPPARHP